MHDLLVAARAQFKVMEDNLVEVMWALALFSHTPPPEWLQAVEVVLVDSAAPPAQLPTPFQLDIEDPNMLPQLRAALDLLTNASVQEHMMRGPHHSGIRLLPGEVAMFEQPSAWPVAKLQELD
ncbi:hypothetical protein HaLaN_28159, partial [Haematococcus lacustris]